jgi:L,D-transpeptidase ErfK/SrfK
MVIRLSRRSVVGAALTFIVSLSLSALAAAQPAVAADYALTPGQQVVGGFGQYTTKSGDLFADLARRFDVGFPELVAANRGIDPWLPGDDRQIKIPTAFVLPNAPQRGIVINLAQWRVFYFPPGGGQVATYPVGLGVVGAKTPLGVTRVARKEPHPAWYPTPSIRAQEPDLPAVVPPGPDNPLGDFALHLGWPNYLLHGTNKPDGVGRNVSHGCIRLYPEDIQRLFTAVAVGTPVRVVTEPATAGWYGNALYVAVYPTKEQVFQLDTSEPVVRNPARGVEAVVREAAGPDAAIDWNAVRQAATERTGMPVRVGTKAPAAIAAVSSADTALGTPPGVTPDGAQDMPAATPALPGGNDAGDIPPGVTADTAQDMPLSAIPGGNDAGDTPPGVMPDTTEDTSSSMAPAADGAPRLPPGVTPDPSDDTQPASADATER